MSDKQRHKNHQAFNGYKYMYMFYSLRDLFCAKIKYVHNSFYMEIQLVHQFYF